MNTDQLRREYIEFFKKKAHIVRPSSPLIPPGDTTMLFTSAGMVPFKDNFFGVAEEPLSRAVSCQKCLRETDLEEVGRTPRHHTFFEMLGNFSFGDYFKEEAIAYAWEFVKDVLKMDTSKIYITVFQDDDEAWDIWHNKMGIPETHLSRLGEKDNFWKMGETGPCGPCSEIYIDCGQGTGCGKADCAPGCECDRFLEFWNLVFTQYERFADGTLKELPRKNIDTGLGLERLASILQGVATNFDTDNFQPILSYLEEIAGIQYGYYEDRDVSFRVIADHIRCVVLAISDGIYPSNEGRGYVIRRILRRAARHGLNLNIESTFLYKLVPPVITAMQGGYPGLMRMREQIAKVIQAEEERFKSTLDNGTRILQEIFAKNTGAKTISATDAFKLFDTYGFPLDLTVDMAEEKGFTVDVTGFEALMESQRDKARSSSNLGYAGDTQESPYQKILIEHGKTEFNGYDAHHSMGKILTILRDGKSVEFAAEGCECEIILDKTPFYGESGGQVGDQGRLYMNDAEATVLDTIKEEGIIAHQVRIVKGSFTPDNTVIAEIKTERRHRILGAHTATHLCHAVLRNVLGTHVQQSGSRVEPDRFRFDFSHFEGLTEEAMAEIERQVNKLIRKNITVSVDIHDLEEAMKLGAMALFDEKYGEKVRVVTIGEASQELCGGTHVARTGEIGLFRIVSESALAAGIRRLEVVTGGAAVEYQLAREAILRQMQRSFNCRVEEIPEHANRLIEANKEMEKQQQNLKKSMIRQNVLKLTESAEQINGLSFVSAVLKDSSGDVLREGCDLILAKLGEGVAVLASVTEGKVVFVAKVSKAAGEKKIHAGNLLREAAKTCDGGGGGRADMAQAGGKDPAKLGEAMNNLQQTVRELLAK